MYIDIVPNRSSPPAVLLRESTREGGKIHKRTLANLSALPADAIEVLRRALKGEKLVPATDAVQVERSVPYGHVAAVLGTIRRLRLDQVRTLMAALATATRTRVRVGEHAFDQLAQLTPLQERAFQLLEVPWR
jgi:hypothetical protein